MKRWITIILVLVLAFSLAGCKKTRKQEHAEGMVGGESTRIISDVLEMTFVEEDEKTGDLLFEIRNPHDNLYVYGYGTVIEVLIDGVWYTTEYGAPDAPAGEINIHPGTTNTWVATLFNDPPVGTYRIVLLEVWAYDESNTRPEYQSIAAEFILE